MQIFFFLAHFNRNSPNFWRLVSKMTAPKIFGVPYPTKVGRSRFVSSKNMILGLILRWKPWFHQFWPQILPPPCHTWLESYGSHLQFGTELSRFEGSYKPSEFLGHVGIERRHWSETLSYILSKHLFACSQLQHLYTVQSRMDRLNWT